MGVVVISITVISFWLRGGNKYMQVYIVERIKTEKNSGTYDRAPGTYLDSRPSIGTSVH